MGALEDSSTPGTLSFVVGSERTLVSVLAFDDSIQRNRIIDTLLRLSSLRSGGAQLYVAAPGFLAATLDSQILRSSGIGLLLYDDRRIEEIVKPEPAQHATGSHQASSASMDATLIAELTALKSKYAELEKNLSGMMIKISSLQDGVRSPGSSAISHDSADVQSFDSLQRPEATFQTGCLTASDLPSFFTNNPWLAVLANRGRTEISPLAG